MSEYLQVPCNPRYEAVEERLTRQSTQLRGHSPADSGSRRTLSRVGEELAKLRAVSEAGVVPMEISERITVKESIPFRHIHQSSPLFRAGFAHTLPWLIDCVRWGKFSMALGFSGRMKWDLMWVSALRNGVCQRRQQQSSCSGSNGRLHGYVRLWRRGGELCVFPLNTCGEGRGKP